MIPEPHTLYLTPNPGLRVGEIDPALGLGGGARLKVHMGSYKQRYVQDV